MRGFIPALVLLVVTALVPQTALAQLDQASPIQLRILANGTRTLSRLERSGAAVLDQVAANTDRTLDVLAARMGPPDPITGPSLTQQQLLTRIANNARLNVVLRRNRAEAQIRRVVDGLTVQIERAEVSAPRVTSGFGQLLIENRATQGLLDQLTAARDDAIETLRARELAAIAAIEQSLADALAP